MVNTGGYFNKGIMLKKMELEALRKRFDVISNNIANADTPGFKRSDVTFESQLKRAIDSENYTGLQAKVTNSKHIPFNSELDWRSVTANRVLDANTQGRNDGNNVDIEKENIDLAKLNLLTQSMLDLIKHDYNMINTALK